MNLWQMLMARRGLMDVAESHERGGAGAGAPLVQKSRAPRNLVSRTASRKISRKSKTMNSEG